MSEYIVGELTGATVPNPPTGKFTLFLDTDGIWKKKDDAGVVTPVSGSSDDVVSISTTGVVVGGFLSPNVGDATLFDISDGNGVVVNGTIIPVPWSGLTGLTATFRLTDNVSYVAINSSGAVIQQNTQFSIEQRRDLIVLGSLVHTGTDITGSTDNVHLVDTYLANDLLIALGNMNLEGNNFNPASTDLTLRKESGLSFRFDSNRKNNPKDPNNLTSGVENPATFLYIYDDGSGGVTVVPSQTLVDPEFYDDGSGTLVALTNNNRWSNQLCYFFPSSGIMIIRYGNEEFASFAEAEAAIGKVPPTIGTGLQPDMIRTTITIKKNETDLTASEVEFTATGKFGLGGGGGAGAGGTFQDLQDTYTNSVTPEIVTDGTRGALTVRRGSALDTDNIYEGQNGAGTETFSVNGLGEITSPTILLKEDKADKGANNGYASLDSGGKVPASELPTELMHFKGNWDADTNTPTLDNTDTGAEGFVYRVSVAGTVDFGAGNIEFTIGDWAYNNGTIWDKGDNTDAVISVAGKQGIVTLDAADITDFDTEVSNNTSVVANTAKVSFPEAPNDGNEYVRKNEAWSAISGAPPASNTYTPTLTDVTNIDSSTSVITMYTETDGHVTLNGSVVMDATNQGQFEIGISLPVSSTFALVTDASGGGWPTLVSSSQETRAWVVADVANNRLALKGFTNFTISQTVYFQARYRIL